MNRKVTILGHFGGNNVFLDGQTVKTKILYDELVRKTNWDIQKIDTYWKYKRPISLIVKLFLALLKKNRIIVLLSGNGMKAFFPILSFFSKYWGVKVFHDVIGGNLDHYVRQFPRFVDYLSSFESNWVETNGLKTRLEECGVCNCTVIPNFKRLEISSGDLPDNNFSEPFCFCTFSRVMKEKGINEAITAVNNINIKSNRLVCKLDIFGVVDDKYKTEFEELLKKNTNGIQYCGLVPYDESTDVIKKYYGLLFPTFWDGEGFPGTIVDAYSAGLPVIATDWNCNSELIQNGYNGFVYKDISTDGLELAIEQYIALSKTDIQAMRQNCIDTARKYQPDQYIEYIIEAMA